MQINEYLESFTLATLREQPRNSSLAARPVTGIEPTSAGWCRWRPRRAARARHRRRDGPGALTLPVEEICRDAALDAARRDGRSLAGRGGGAIARVRQRDRA
jgi:hypothetical protein